MLSYHHMMVIAAILIPTSIPVVFTLPLSLPLLLLPGPILFIDIDLVLYCTSQVRTSKVINDGAANNSVCVDSSVVSAPLQNRLCISNKPGDAIPPPPIASRVNAVPLLGAPYNLYELMTEQTKVLLCQNQIHDCLHFDYHVIEFHHVYSDTKLKQQKRKNYKKYLKQFEDYRKYIRSVLEEKEKKLVSKGNMLKKFGDRDLQNIHKLSIF